MAAQPAAIDPRAFAVVAQEAARRVRVRQDARGVADDWAAWLRLIYPGYVARGFAPFHEEFWRWVWALEYGQRARPFVGVWPRGYGKSTSVELACAAIAARQSRRYALYVCETQEQGDDHVGNVAGMLEARTFGLAYPEASARKLSKYGNSRGWRRNRLRTASGFTIDAIGLDTAARGVKLDEDRPDLLIFDDLDGKHDTAATTDKKIGTLTHTLLPAASDAPAVLAIQNLVIPDGIFSQLSDGRADFLADRIVSGPHPAIRNLTTEQRDGRTVVTGGEPTWDAIGLDTAQAQIDEMGITAYLAEKQHSVEAPAGGMFDQLAFRHCRRDELPDLVRTVVWVDPAVTDSDRSDAHGIQADAMGEDGVIYRLYSWEARTSPSDVLRRAILKAVELGADYVGIETDQGGDTWEAVYWATIETMVQEGAIAAAQTPAFEQEKAGRGYGPKTERASRMLAGYERAELTHVVGTHETLERALRRFPRTKPYDLVDAAVWGYFDLTGQRKPEPAPAVLAQAGATVRWAR
ncbi:MAG: hypothetical protein QM692_09320 [Thermomicrobiales bacterium]